jgi:probable DNA repair protein
MQQALAGALRRAGWNTEWLAAEPVEARTAAAGFADRRAETAAAASWVRGALDGDAPPSIGIVVPDLRARRRLIEEILDDVLDPGALRLPEKADGRAYSIAQGEPLANHPLVAAALTVLSLGGRRIALDAAGVLLRTPFLMRSAGEAPELARLDRALRRRGEWRFDLRDLLRAAETPPREGGAVPAIAERLRRIADMREALPPRQSARGWGIVFSKILTASGWPGWRPLDSGEYQAAEAWREMLDEFAGLEVFGETWDFDTALATLRRLAEADFQPRTGETPVEVLGMEGAADMGFDRLWVMGLEEGAWPPAARPSPFLPMRMQHDLAMPFATPGIALGSARVLTQRFAGCAGTVVFSYPENDAETPLRASPLIRPWRNAEIAPLASVPDYLRQVHGARSVEFFEDGQAAPVAPGWPARGGATLLRDQAACPFRAFARHRLGARPVDPVDIGLDARERGRLVHAVLDSVWAALRDHATLARSGDAELDAIVIAAVDRAVEEVRRRRPATVTPRFAEVESLRLRKLARDWLALERSRAPFTVEAREQAREVAVGALQLKLRVDRIDRMPDGRKAILDYKTGEAHAADWLGERPDAPQLPLYAVTAGEPIAALAFAQIRPGAHAFVGAGESADLLPGLLEPDAFRKSTGLHTWPQLLARWQRDLEALAAEFVCGQADVNPKTPKTCEECDLHAFCRVHESRPWSGDPDD